MKTGPRKRPIKDNDPDDYLAAVADFTENEDCAPVEAVPLNARCIEIARQFNKTPQDVARDINRVYLDSYRRPKGGTFNLLDDR